MLFKIQTTDALQDSVQYVYMSVQKYKLPTRSTRVVYSYKMNERKKDQNLSVYLALSNIYCAVIVKDIRTYSRITYSKSPSFPWQHSAQVSQILRSSYFSHVTAAMTQWVNTCTSTSLSRRNTLIDTHTTSHALLTCESSLDLLSLRASGAGDVVEFFVLQ